MLSSYLDTPISTTLFMHFYFFFENFIYVYNVLWSYPPLILPSTPLRLSLPTSCPLSFHSPLSLVYAAHMPLGVRPPSGIWSTFQGGSHTSEENWLSLLQKPSTGNSSWVKGGPCNLLPRVYAMLIGLILCLSCVSKHSCGQCATALPSPENISQQSSPNSGSCRQDHICPRISGGGAENKAHLRYATRGKRYVLFKEKKNLLCSFLLNKHK